MSLDKQALFWLAATVGGYLLSRQLYRRVKWYWLSPIVFVPVLLYALAIPTHTRYADYARDTNWLVALLGPATVAFAIPIWQQRELLMRHWVDIVYLLERLSALRGRPRTTAQRRGWWAASEDRQGSFPAWWRRFAAVSTAAR